MANLARPISIGTLGPGWGAHEEPEIPPEPESPPAMTGNASPSSSPVSGGTTHMLPGTGFEGVTRVLLSASGGWSSDAVDFEVVSSQQLWFEAPEYTGGNSPPFASTVTLWHPLGNASRAGALVYVPGAIEEPEPPPEEEVEPE